MIEKKKKIIVVHPTGNANLRSLLLGLYRNHLLHSFQTSIANFSGTIWRFLEKFPGLGDFKRRVYTENLKSLTSSHPYKELGRLLSSKLGFHTLTQQEIGYFCIDKVYMYIDQLTSKLIKKSNHIDAVYAYEDGALESFNEARKKKLYCFYDLPIGYWRAMRSYLEPENTLRPEWKATLVGFNDSEEKLNRKDKELELADHIFVASSFTKKTLELYPKKLPPVHVVPYGFPHTESCKIYREIKEEKLKLLFVGGLSQRKGIAQVFDCYLALKDRVELKIIGKKSVDNCKILDENLSMVDWIPSLSHSEILKEMRQADVFIFPSLFEGYGLVIAEAMAQGTPVITTDRTCGADYISSGFNGWLVEAGNTESLENQIIELIKNPDLIERVGQQAYKTALKNPTSDYGVKMALVLESLM